MAQVRNGRLTQAEAQGILRCGYATLLGLIARGELETVRQGTRTFVLRRSVERFLAARERDAAVPA